MVNPGRHYGILDASSRTCSDHTAKIRTAAEIYNKPTAGTMGIAFLSQLWLATDPAKMLHQISPALEGNMVEEDSSSPPLRPKWTILVHFGLADPEFWLRIR